MSGRGNVQSHTFRLVADSSGAASDTKVIKGILRMIVVEYDSSSAAGTDTTVTGLIQGGPGAGVTVTYLTRTNVNTSFVAFPYAFSESNAGVASTTIYTAPIPIDNVVTASIAQQTADKGATITLFVE